MTPWLVITLVLNLVVVAVYLIVQLLLGKKARKSCFMKAKDTETQPATATEHDAVNHPHHYTSHPSGVECIQITRHYCFAIGNAIKYLWRAGLKQDVGTPPKEKEIQDLEKAIWYINDRIKQLQEL